ncbi:hypothetical protein G9P44_003327 [Scheffersomyces stipitis]|nr:hypothetical protein G9P44_003327 [Scheffersomyces stipitis]
MRYLSVLSILVLIASSVGYPVENGKPQLVLSTKTNNVKSENDNSARIERIPDQVEGASVARTLVKRESLTNLNTIKKIKRKDGSVRSLPVSGMEYYADCDESGDPYLLLVDIGSSFQNILKGSDYSLTIRAGDHPSIENVDLNYPGSIAASPAGSPRVQLSGRLVQLTYTSPFDPELIKLERCFLRRHPDAQLWLPHNVVSPHSSHWFRFEVDDVYFVGGFGSSAYIGEIDADLYHSVSPLPDPDNSGPLSGDDSEALL